MVLIRDMTADIILRGDIIMVDVPWEIIISSSSSSSSTGAIRSMVSVSVEICCMDCLSDNSNAPVSRMMEDGASVVVAVAVDVAMFVLEVKESVDFIRMILGL